jgi:hypothetical protein
MWLLKSHDERTAIRKKMADKLRGRPSWNKGLPWSEAHKERISLQCKARGQRPVVRGGNGHVAPAEAAVREMLPAAWEFNLAVPTKQPRGSGYPTCYKVDFGNLRTKTVLEVDGGSHRSRALLDAKKDAFLASLGWRVFRISNATALSKYSIFKSTGRMTFRSLVS